MTWVAEVVPAHLIFTGEGLEPAGDTRAILIHRSRVAAGRAMGHHLHLLARRPAAASLGDHALLLAAGDLFKASGSTTRHTDLALRIRNQVYRVREEAD